MDELLVTHKGAFFTTITESESQIFPRNCTLNIGAAFILNVFTLQRLCNHLCASLGSGLYKYFTGTALNFANFPKKFTFRYKKAVAVDCHHFHYLALCRDGGRKLETRNLASLQLRTNSQRYTRGRCRVGDADGRGLGVPAGAPVRG